MSDTADTRRAFQRRSRPLARLELRQRKSACTHYLVFKEPDADSTRPRLIGAGRRRRVPTERPFPSVFGEPSKVTSRIPRCQPPFSSFRRTRLLGLGGADLQALAWSRLIGVPSTGMAPVRRTFQSYDWPSVLSTDRRSHPCPGVPGTKKLLRLSGAIIRCVPAGCARRFIDITDRFRGCQPLTIWMRKLSFFPLRIRNS